MIKIINILRTILSHPYNRRRRLSAIKTFLKWQISSRLMKCPIVFNWIGGAKFIVKSGDTGLTGNIYCGLHEFEEMNYLLDNLKAGETFVDIGANLGSYTILAGKVVGADCISIEPVPSTFNRLEDNLRINRIDSQVKAFNIGLADKSGELYFTSNVDTENHVIQEGNDFGIKVKVMRLDDLLEKFSPKIIKIDVEGYELPVLKGAVNSLKENNLKSIIIELNGSGSRYNFDENDIVQILRENNFKPFEYNVEKKALSPIREFKGVGNVIFHRDV